MSDQPSSPGYYVDEAYLEAAAAAAQATKERSTHLLRLTADAALLDVGCGPGIDTTDNAAALGAHALVVGIDIDLGMSRAAELRAATRPTSCALAHLCAACDRLPFPDEAFDAARCDRLFQHLADPVPTVKEMMRVVRTGGRIVVVDTDWSSLSIDTDYVDVERLLSQHKTDALTVNGYSGRQLFRLCRDVGLEDVTVEPFTLFAPFSFARVVLTWGELVESALAKGIVTLTDIQSLEVEQRAREAMGGSFGTLNVILAAGTVPPHRGSSGGELG